VDQKICKFHLILTPGQPLQVATVFLGLLQVKEVDAASLCQRVLECLATFGIPIEKVVCFGSDGASVMTGKYWMRKSFFQNFGCRFGMQARNLAFYFEHDQTSSTKI
jgi:hypothetical protein